MQMYDRNDLTDNWKTAKCADPMRQDISLRGREKEKGDMKIDGREKKW